MEEFSQAVVEERDLVNEKLKMKESEIEQERILRMELCERLKELQNKVNQSTHLLSICEGMFCSTFDGMFSSQMRRGTAWAYRRLCNAYCSVVEEFYHLL